VGFASVAFRGFGDISNRLRGVNFGAIPMKHTIVL
jgi:hypothetical protein